MSLAGKHVVIKGGGSGLGAELARRIATHDARVTILGRRIEPLQDVARETGTAAFACDVTDRASLDRTINRAIAQQGEIVLALATAGAAPSQPGRESLPARRQRLRPGLIRFSDVAPETTQSMAETLDAVARSLDNKESQNE